MIKNFFNTKGVLITTIPAQAQPGMIDYTFLLPGKNEKNRLISIWNSLSKKTKKIHNTNLRSCKFLRRAKMFQNESKMESGDPW